MECLGMTNRGCQRPLLLYDKVNRICTPLNVYLINEYIMIPTHTSSTHNTHTTIFGWMILITMMSLTLS